MHTHMGHRIAAFALIAIVIVTGSPSADGKWVPFVDDVKHFGDQVHGTIVGGLDFLGFPTPEGFERSGKKVAATANTQLNATLAEHEKALDTILTNKTDAAKVALEDVLTSSISSLDDVLRNTIIQGADLLDEQRGHLEVTLLRCTEVLNLSLRKLLLGFGFLIFLFAAWNYIATGIKAGKSFAATTKRGAPIFFAVAALSVFLGYFATRDTSSEDFAQRTNDEYKDAVKNRNLAKAAYFAGQLQELDSTSITYAARAAKARILRDAIERPTVYRTPNGLVDFDRAIDEAQSMFAKLGKRDADLDAVHAMIIWQMAASRLDEYYAANFAAMSLSEGGSEASTEGIARYYLEAYLANPIDDFVKQYQIGVIEHLGGIDRYLTASEMRAILGSTTPHPASERPSPNQIYVTAIKSAYTSIVPQYVQATQLLAEAQLPAKAAGKDDLLATRKDLCEKIAKEWADFSAVISSATIPDVSLRIESLKSAMSIADRAKQCAADPKKLPPSTGIADQVPEAKNVALGNIKPLVPSHAYQLIEKLTNDHYADESSKLVAFELALVKLVAASNTPGSTTLDQLKNFAVDAASLGTSAGLFVCNASGLTADITNCDQQLPSTQPVLMFVKASVSTHGLTVGDEAFKDLRQAVVSRRIMPIL
jgi:hypothetical protein